MEGERGEGGGGKGGRAVEDRGSEKGMTSHYICSGTQLESLKNS